MTMLILKRVILLSILSLLSSCTKETPTLVGRWSGVDTHDNHQTFIFNADNSLTWIVAEAGTLRVNYRYDTSTLPRQLDIFGFQGPPLEGQSLYGIVEFDGNNSFRFDCEAGPADKPGDSFRPQDFTKDTVTYTRVE